MSTVILFFPSTGTPTNTVQPSISGTPKVGQVLTGSDGTWVDATSLSRQWKRNGVAISGQTGSTYTLTSADDTKSITFEVTATNSQGSSVAASAPVSVTFAAPVNTSAPVISGSQIIGNTLTATTGAWSNLPTSYAYQWKRDGVNISGAIGAQYITVSADATHTVTCQVTATNDGGSTAATSNGLAISAPGAAPVNVTSPDVLGDERAGSLLTAYNGIWTNGPFSYQYQWRRDGVIIPGAINSTYLLTTTDVGLHISLTVMAINATGSSSATSQPTGAILPPTELSQAFQPVLPPEGVPTQAELAFMQEEPPGFFPENQDSNFGYVIRKMWTDQMQQGIDQLQLLYNERFIETSTEFIEEWEKDYGIPSNQAITLERRRGLIKARTRKGAFTRAMRRQIIEDFLQSIYLTPIQLVPQGVPFDSTGIPIGAESVASVTDLYTILEVVENFFFAISLAPTVSIDQPALTRELLRWVPAGISFGFGTYTKTSLYDSYATYEAVKTAYATYEDLLTDVFMY